MLSFCLISNNQAFFKIICSIYYEYAKQFLILDIGHLLLTVVM